MKLTILFVDDDKNIIQGIKRTLHSFESKWNLLYAYGSAEAINILQQNTIDVIISDIRMPGLDGTELLSYVKNFYPKVMRITLSGFANEDIAVKNSRIAHQSISKPTNIENLIIILERADKLRQKLNNDELMQLVNNLDGLPSLPEIYIELENEFKAPILSIDKVSEIILKDPIISAKILQLTNSAFFGSANKIISIKQAVNFLGVKLVQNLVLTIKLFKSFDPDSPFIDYYHKIWEHSNKVANISKQISMIKNLQKHVVEEAYLAGLLHDIGKLILLEKYKNFKNIDVNKISELENNYPLNMFPEVGAYLIGLWGLPDTIIEAIAFQQTEKLLNTNDFQISKIIYIADYITKSLDIDTDNLNENLIDSVIVKLSKN
ncbi:MAG: HDOD domain-containing protein [Ignavibacteriales bacterium]|nr:HDOD domain-containing protein [Ignavibacteriales bacterium]